MTIYLKSFALAVSAILLFSACSAPSPEKPAAKHQLGNLINYGDAPLWATKLHKKQGKFRVIQFGDSHTAGDYLTDSLRNHLKQRLGDGGIGFIPPAAVKGQRTAGIQYHNNGWQPLSSRRDSAQFALGGILARSSGNATMMIMSENAQIGPQKITFIVNPVRAQAPLSVHSSVQSGKILPKYHGWQQIPIQAGLPIRYQAVGSDVWDIGGIYIENHRQNGAVVSASGINGAQFSQWQKWGTHWITQLKATQADLVILAYGTNEAFNDNLEIAEMERLWKQQIRQIKQALPKAAILIVSAPESLKQNGGVCAVRPLMLDSVQLAQQKIARQERVMYWSWEKAMGGKCSAKRWQSSGLMSKDGVHFTPAGYQRIGKQLAEDILKFKNAG